jgi:hypothetical protein
MPPEAPAKLPVVVSGQPRPEKAKAVSPAKLAVPSEGVVFLPPAELPTCVTAAATELATQKLMARSLSGPKGVAASLAHKKVGPSGPDGSELILAGGLMDYEGAPVVEERNPQSYSTTGFVKLTASKEEIAANAHLDYVTSGVVILGNPEEPTITSPPAGSEQSLRNSIQAACGGKIKDLELNLESDHTLRIRLQVPWDLEQELRHTILALPALADYKVHLSIQVSP